MAVTVSNLIMGPAVLYVAPFGTTEPATAGTAPAVGWVDVGGTDGGVSMSISQSYTSITVDQIAQPVGSRLSEQTFTIKTTMAEATLANLRSSLNMPVSAGTTLELDGEIGNVEPTYRAIMIKGPGPANAPRLVILRRALQTGSVEMAYTKDGKTTLSVEFTAYYVSSSVKAIKIDDTPGP